ncbi:MAG: hypothetical protein BYD32DRAFT_233526 [Podila humilis]|nr:MAG: hypothetical protein BYD32DRAFT_233526 [Podila humilis]
MASPISHTLSLVVLMLPWADASGVLLSAKRYIALYAPSHRIPRLSLLARSPLDFAISKVKRQLFPRILASLATNARLSCYDTWPSQGGRLL